MDTLVCCTEYRLQPANLKMLITLNGKTILFVCACLLFGAAVAAARLNKEDAYNQFWCAQQGGQVEVVLEDRTRVDCITPNGYAVEADFANKYSEGVGQALHYAAVTGKSPGILLIVEDWDQDQKYLDRLYKTLTRTCPAIRVWLITPSQLPRKNYGFMME